MRQAHKYGLLLCLLLPLTTFALESDQKEIVQIEADATNFNYKTGINIFEGNVKVNQGTTHITADRLITKNNTITHKIQEVIAYGENTLAHYWTVPQMNEAEVHAEAKIIRFYPIESNVTLEQNVIMRQGDNRFKGEIIHYNRTNQTITVPATKNGRAVLVYNPSK